ncbi:MAG: homoserine kinase [Sandaracinaceae bacterium]|nr:homoserine kinase [Sandaracinaceae bacterium]
MAIYTELSLEEADRISRAHGLGAALGVEGVPAGSVNSNFFVDTEARRVFVRIYEEQEADGVEHEWALLDHLRGAGLPVPARVAGAAPGELRVAGKPTAVFEVVGGHEVCQRMVGPARARAVGALLARAHLAAPGFHRRRAGRFTRADVRRRLDGVAALDRPELREAVGVLYTTLDELDGTWPAELPGGVVHGDLFRDNVRWEGDAIACVLDWESAADDAFVYDLAVTTLAWCFGDTLEAPLVEAMWAGYEAVRPLSDREARARPLALRAAAARFTVTRITDYHLRSGGAQVTKDWRRFYRRLLCVRP